MSDENIISMLVSETLKPTDSTGLPHSDAIFNRRRELSKLPVKAWSGEFIHPQIARFHVGVEIIDIPVSFGVAQFFMGVGGSVHQLYEETFFQAVAPLFDTPMTAVYVIRGSEGNPWMVFWNEEIDGSLAEHLQEIFTPARTPLSIAA